MAAIKEVEFENRHKDRLSARLHLPQGPYRGTALFAHCFTCSKDSIAARRIASGLAAEGIACLRFDFTGLGHFKGRLPSRALRVISLIAKMRSRGLAPIIKP